MASNEMEERQNDELEFLQAVFGDDFRDLRKNDAWQVTCGCIHNTAL